MKKIGIITSGGDCPGMNAAIRSVARTCLFEGITPYAVEGGYRGLIEDKIRPLESKDVANIIQRGGTVLRSARCPEFMTENGQKTGVANLQKHGIEGLVVIGGDGSLRGANAIYSNYGIPVVGLPGSIDNDIFGTDICIGVDTALNTIVTSIDMINDTASSHDRTFLIEVMGRHCGYLAISAAIASGAEAALIPEVKFDLSNVIEKIRKRYKEGKTRSIIVVSEGVGSAYDFGIAFNLIGGFDTRITVLGHLQRGGIPTYYDRNIASKFGMAAVYSLIEGHKGVMLGLQKSTMVPVPLSDVLNNKKTLDKRLMDMAEILS